MNQLSLLIVFVLLLSRTLTVYAVSETPAASPSPTAPTVTITDVPSPEPTLIQETLTPTATPTVSITPTPEYELTPTISPTDQELLITPEPVLQKDQEASSSSEIINKEPHQTESTASASAIETGHAENNVTVDNIVNTNITGNNNCLLILSHNFDTQDILNLTDTCQNIMITTETSSDNETSSKNDTEIQTTIQAVADTGKNVLVVPQGSIHTGNSSVQVDVFNLVNTNIAGDNTLFGIINLFDTKQGDIILPYELDYILKGDRAASQATLIDQTLNQDTLMSTNIDVIVNTGANTGAERIETGNATSSIKIYDKLNTTIIGSNFLILEINTFGAWDGKLLGWWGDILTDDNTTIAMYNGLNSTESRRRQSNDANNTATVQNTIQVISNTGGNIASNGAEIKTGDAAATVNVFDFVNTNISGSNWYHVVINIFDSFKGNIIFPRPDLTVETTAEKTSVNEGDTVRFETNFSNEGILFARDAYLETEIPEHLEFLDASLGGIFSGGVIRWDLGKLLAKDIGSVWFRTKATKSSDSTVVRTTIKTSTDEPEQENNLSFLSLVISLISPSPSSENSDLEQQEIPDTYLQATIPILSIDIEPVSTGNAVSSGPITTTQTVPPNHTDILGEETSKPHTKAESFSPLFFLMLYMSGTGFILLKEWLEG